MQTSRRDIFLLACCQALLLTNASGLITMNGLVGLLARADKTLATFGATTYVLGSALATMPLSLWMARGRPARGFMTGAAINVVGCALGALARCNCTAFALFCVATGIIGIYNAIGLQYRFAAAEVAAPATSARAISLVLAGGVVGGFIGPQATRCRATISSPRRSMGSFVMLAACALVALAVQSQVRVPRAVVDERTGRRPAAVVDRRASRRSSSPHSPARSATG